MKPYRQAMADGLRALQGKGDNLDFGPRSKQEVSRMRSAQIPRAPSTPGEPASAHEAVAIEPPTHSTSDPERKATAFGFGLPL